MNETGDLFDERYLQKGSSFVPRDSTGTARIPGSRRNNVHTSAQAALSAIGLASKHQAVILADLTLYGISTGHEIAARVGLTYQQISKRLPELMEQGKIERIATGRDEQGKAIYWTRASPAGRQCCVWTVR